MEERDEVDCDSDSTMGVMTLKLHDCENEVKASANPDYVIPVTHVLQLYPGAMQAEDVDVILLHTESDQFQTV